MRRAPPSTGDVEPVADLDTLDRLDRHERLGDHAVELAIPVDVATEADRHVERQHLDDTAEAVALLRRRLDLGDHVVGGGQVETPHLALVDAVELFGRRPG